MNLYFFGSFIFIASLIFLYFFTIYPMKLGKILNLVDYPNTQHHKRHQVPIPSIGGVVIYVMCINYFFICTIFKVEMKNESLLYFLILFNFIFWLGIADDLFKIKAINRIIIIIGFLYILNLNFNSFNINYFYSEIFMSKINVVLIDPLFTAFCFFILYNIFNMLDGINGLMITYSLGCVFIIFSFINYPIFFIMLIIILIVLLILNIKNKIFLGNNGSSLLSFIIAFFIIQASKENEIFFSEINIIILFFLPFIDFLRLFFFRLFKKQNPMKGDNNHFHHIVLSKISVYVWISILIIYFCSFYFLINYVNSLIYLIILISVYFYLINIFNKSN